MSQWVCEFLDDEWAHRPVIAPPPGPGWRQGPWANEVVEVPRVLVARLAQPNRMSDIVADADHIDNLTASIGSRGFDEPMVVVVDKHGRMLLKDGHHRLVAATRLGLGRVPIRFREGEKIGSPTAQPVATMLPALLLAVADAR